MYHSGERTLDALDEFVMMFIRTQVPVPTISQLRSTDKPMAYILGPNRIGKNALTRIAFRLVCIYSWAVVVYVLGIISSRNNK